MSKPASTIAAKPQIDAALQWIGGTSPESNASQETNGITVHRAADKSASQQADKSTSQLQTEAQEITAMLSARMPKKLIQRLRVRAATEGRHIQDIVADLISDYLGEE